MAILRIAVAAPGNQTAPSSFGHFCDEVPKSLHISAYPRVFLREVPVSFINESPANGHYLGRELVDELSNCHAEGRGFESLQPLFENALHLGGLVRRVSPQNQLEPPRISPLFQALLRISAWNGPMCGHWR
jgi:hypothetical protein